MTGTLTVFGPSRERIEFDTENPDSIDRAREKFDTLVSSGASAFVDGERQSTFDPSARETEVIQPFSGG